MSNEEKGKGEKVKKVFCGSTDEIEKVFRDEGT